MLNFLLLYRRCFATEVGLVEGPFVSKQIGKNIAKDHGNKVTRG